MSRWTARCGMLLALLASALPAQEYGARLGTVLRNGRLTYEPTGPGAVFEALDPAMRKWYVPQEYYIEYRWQPWQYANYARENYQAYVSPTMEGDYYYDVFGNLLTRGWLIYDWREETPAPFGSAVQQTSQYRNFFNSLAIASDHKGQYHYAITVGSQIRTTLTPMTFSKPLFSGIQLDFASDKYLATALLSRISAPNAVLVGGMPATASYTNVTNLFGGRGVAQVGDWVKIGATLINAHQAQTQLQAINGDLRAGQLTESTNFSAVREILVRISDDSPEDGAGGGALYNSDLRIHGMDGSVIRASELSFRPRLEGGFQRPGYLAADGQEQILLRYDFTDPRYAGVDPTEIVRVEVELVVANDYLIEVSSSSQADANGNLVFLPVARARGNIQDGSNQRVLRFDYGIPTANQILGFTVELSDAGGLSGYTEVNLNNQYRQYPNPSLDEHHVASREALAWLGSLAYQRRPWFGLLEAFSIAPGYSTSMVTCDQDGALGYNRESEIYEFVDDNDDQDRRPDWKRKGYATGDEEIFPGWDENNDFLSDFNESPNLIPDYEEPFLRYYSDSPEYLYGVDANHNGWVDRFENDEEPDYPYPRDRRGYNLFAGLFLGRSSRLMAGRMSVRQLAEAHRNRANYLMLTVDHEQPGWGRLRLYQDLSRVRDDIAEDLVQWMQPPNTQGALQSIRDPLAARDTWLNTTWLGWSGQPREGLSTEHKLKVQTWRQQADDQTIAEQGLRRTSLFLGLIDKAEYQFSLGPLTVWPRWKSEYRRQWPVMRTEPRRLELDEVLMLVSRLPVMSQSQLELGVEYEIFSQLRRPTPAGANDSFRALTGHLQVSNRSSYLGYLVNAVMGFQLSRTSPESAPSELSLRTFLTLYAGVER